MNRNLRLKVEDSWFIKHDQVKSASLQGHFEVSILHRDRRPKLVDSQRRLLVKEAASRDGIGTRSVR